MSDTVRILSYNVQAPWLPSMLPKDRTLCEKDRLQIVWKTIWRAVAASKVPTFVCLQEMCLPWLSMMEKEMDGFNFKCISSDYSPVTFAERKPLYTAIFYMPRYFDYSAMSDVLTGTASNDQKQRLGLKAHDVAMNGRKCNAILSGLFTSTGAPGGLSAGKRIVVSTYHAPCVYQFPPSQALHFENALEFLHRQTFPAILTGDMNTKPTDSAYCSAFRLLKRDVIDVMHELTHGEHLPTSCSPDMESSCLDYIFVNKLVKPISIRVQSFLGYNILCDSQPSDHGLLVALLKI